LTEGLGEQVQDRVTVNGHSVLRPNGLRKSKIISHVSPKASYTWDMKRFIFSVSSGEPKLISDETQKILAANYASLDPSFEYLRPIRWTLDPGDLADIHLIEQNGYKDPNSALAKKFMGSATATAAGLADIFARPGFTIIYVCIEVMDDSYKLSVLQDAHPKAINGGKTLAAPSINADLVRTAIKNRIAAIVAPLKMQLAHSKARAVAALPASAPEV